MSINIPIHKLIGINNSQKQKPVFFIDVLFSFTQVDEKTEGEPGWLYGSFQGHFGWFPCNYVEKIPENENATSHPKKALLPPTVSLSTASVPME